MRAGKLSKPGRILVYLMSFLVAFSSISTYCLEAVYAAANTVSIRGEEDLRGMLSVSSIIDDNWANDDTLKNLLNERDLRATEYAKENNLLGAYSRSEDIGEYEGSRHWLSNVMYEGTVLRANSFDGFIVSYNDSDAAIIKEGINEIDVVITPVVNTTVDPEGADNDIKDWDKQYGFASRFMLPHWSTSDEGLKLRDGWGYHTKLFIVGITNKDGEENRIYSGNEMSYVEFLSYIGADPTPANLQSYLNYVATFNNIKKQRDNRVRSIQQWLEWQRLMNDDNDNGSHHRHGDEDGSNADRQDPMPDPEPEEEVLNRVLMIYMDVSDLTGSAKDNLEELVKNSRGLSDHTRIYVLTGGAKAGASVRVKDVDGNEKEIVYNDCNKLWEIRDGQLMELDTFRNSDAPFYPDMSKPETLTNFIKDVIYYDSGYDQYNMLYDLILWSHAGGPKGGFGSEDRIVNKNAKNALSLKEIVKALKDSKVTFDFIAFDACLMSNAEVALALAPYADYYLGAETTQPGDGLDYKNLIETLKDDPYIKTFTGDKNSGYDGLARIIVDSVFNKYLNKSDVTYAVLDLKSMTQGDEADVFWNALSNFSEKLSSYVYDNNGNINSSALYAVLAERQSSLSPESMVGQNNNGLVDLRSLCIALSNFNDMKEVCEDLDKATENINYYIRSYSHLTETGANGGSVPNGLSIYFPGLWRRYTSENDNYLTIKDQIENLLKVYRETEYQGNAQTAVKNSYRKALASYGLWLSTGELMKKYWNDLNPDGSIKASWADDTTTALYYQFATTASDTEWQKALGNNANEIISAVIEKQINDSIQKSDITVAVSGDKKTLTVTSVNPEFVDRTEVTVSVKINAGDQSQIGKNVSLGHTRDYSTAKTTPNNDTVNFTLTKFDNKWFQIGSQIVSFYETDPIDNKRRGYIPVGYWTSVGVIDNHTTTKIKDAIDNGQLNLGMFLVEFDDDTTGRIVSYRGLNTEDFQSSTYDISNNEKYELLANFDKAFDEKEVGQTSYLYDSLVSLGTFTVSDNVRKDNGDGTRGDVIVELTATPELSSTYEIVDIYESRYGLNTENFDGTDNNLDSFHTDPTSGTVAAYYENVTVQKNDNDDHKEEHDRALSSEETAAPEETAPQVTSPAEAIPAEITPPTLIPLTGDPEADALIAQQNAEALAAYQAEVLAAQTAQIAAIQESVEAAKAQETAGTSGIDATDINGITAEAVPGLDTEADIITNPLTGEAMSTAESGVTNQDGNTTNETEYVTAGLGEESSTSISESESSSGGDTGSGDGGDGGSDGDSSGSEGGDSGSDDSGDTGSDSTSSDSESSSESSSE